MKVSDLFQRLAADELQNLSIASAGSINPTATTRIINYTNEALLKLYSRFMLKENDLLLQLYSHITNYRLIPQYAVNYVATTPTENRPIRYILDLPNEPFQDELIKVTEVFDFMGHPLKLNDENQHFSVFTPQVKMLQVPNPVTGMFLNVKYQQRHPILSAELSDYIELPDVLETALTSFIAYKVFSHMNSQDSTSKAQEFMSLYEATCNEVVEREMFNLSISQTNARFEEGGWC